MRFATGQCSAVVLATLLGTAALAQTPAVPPPAVAANAPKAAPPLIPRETLFGNPERASPRLSPDGLKLAWLAPDKKDVLQVWVKTVGKDDDVAVTADKHRGIRN